MREVILMVKYNDILREIIKDSFLNVGYEVLEAIDRKEALSLFEENEVHLVIVDIMLPEADGWSVCQRIRRASNVPIIMLTPDNMLPGFELGTGNYLTKLVERAKRLIDSRCVKNELDAKLSR
jgi:DNA-binding response OmpR family regulator